MEVENNSGESSATLQKRRRGERRLQYSPGYIKLAGGVGWYCRRYRTRRKVDSTMSSQDQRDF
jgi:hypothetical protein